MQGGGGSAAVLSVAPKVAVVSVRTPTVALLSSVTLKVAVLSSVRPPEVAVLSVCRPPNLVMAQALCYRKVLLVTFATSP